MNVTKTTCFLQGFIRGDYVNPNGINVSKLWREINRKVPRRFEYLKKEDYYFFPNGEKRSGSFANFYKIGKGIGCKVLKNSLNPSLSNKVYLKLRNEFMKYELSEILEKGVLPENYGLVLIKNTKTNLYVPSIVQRDLGEKTLNITDISDENFSISQDSFFEKYNRIKKHLFGDSEDNDIYYYNAIFVPKEKQTYLIDPAYWKFKGVFGK